MSPRLRRARGWVAVAVLLVLGVSAAYSLVLYWPWITRTPIGSPRYPLPAALDILAPADPERTNRRDFGAHFVGHSESSIVERYGEPTGRWKGHYGMPPLIYRRAYRESVSVVYQRPSGSLYLSYCREEGRWVCFSAHWLPKGAEF